MKRILSTILLIAITLSAALICGCNGDQTYVEGEFYTLQEAYDNGYLTQEYLEKIADYHNQNISCPESLEEKESLSIKKSAVYYALTNEENRVTEAKEEDFKILRYYGRYDDCYAIIMNHPYEEAPAVIIDEWVAIGGVQFHYIGSNKIVIWKIN